MKCPKCNKDNREEAKFCFTCGYKLENESGAKTPPAPAIKEVSHSPSSTAAAPPPTPAPPAGHDCQAVRPLPKTLRGGRYNVITELGAGNMGRVILAEDTMMNFPVVVKEMLPNFSDEKDREYKEKRFKEEARILFRLKHPNLPRVTEFFTEDGSMFLAMEYVEGENLQKLLKGRPGMCIEIDEAINWMESVLDVLKYVHNQDPPILHRDIKPPNIMLTKAGEILLVDFGIARTLEATAYTHIGTPGFASLDHYTGNFSPSSDIYSLGATFHYLVTGSNPRSRKEFDFPPISSFRDDVPPEVDKIFGKMLELKPKNRYQKAEEVLEEIKKYKMKLSGKTHSEEEKPTDASIEAVKPHKSEEFQAVEVEKAVAPKPASDSPTLKVSVEPAKPSGALYVIFAILLIIIALGAFFLGKHAANKPDDKGSPTPSILPSGYYYFEQIQSCSHFEDFIGRKTGVFR